MSIESSAGAGAVSCRSFGRRRRKEPAAGASTAAGGLGIGPSQQGRGTALLRPADDGASVARRGRSGLCPLREAVARFSAHGRYGGLLCGVVRLAWIQLYLSTTSWLQVACTSPEETRTGMECVSECES